MPNSPWIDPMLSLPDDGATVWIRRLTVEIPYTVTYQATTTSFLCPNGEYLKWYFVSRWRLP